MKTMRHHRLNYYFVVSIIFGVVEVINYCEMNSEEQSVRFLMVDKC